MGCFLLALDAQEHVLDTFRPLSKKSIFFDFLNFAVGQHVHTCTHMSACTRHQIFKVGEVVHVRLTCNHLSCTETADQLRGFVCFGSLSTDF